MTLKRWDRYASGIRGVLFNSYGVFAAYIEKLDGNWYATLRFGNDEGERIFLGDISQADAEAATEALCVLEGVL